MRAFQRTSNHDRTIDQSFFIEKSFNLLHPTAGFGPRFFICFCFILVSFADHTCKPILGLEGIYLHIPDFKLFFSSGLGVWNEYLSSFPIFSRKFIDRALIFALFQIFVFLTYFFASGTLSHTPAIFAQTRAML